VTAADYRNFAGILSDPNNMFGIHKDFHAVHIFKHYKLHAASFWFNPYSPLRNDKVTTVSRLFGVKRQSACQLLTITLFYAAVVADGGSGQAYVTMLLNTNLPVGLSPLLTNFGAHRAAACSPGF
jgi:hypothetical protein